MKLQKALSTRRGGGPIRGSMTVEEKGVGFGYSTPESREGTDCEHHGTVSAIWTPLHQGSNSVWKASKHEWLIILVIAIVSLMVALDATILVTVLPAIASDLHGNATNAFWTGTSYLLAQAVVQPFIVSLSDIFGRQLLYLLSLGFFTIGTLLCCLAKDFTALLTGRSIQGVGGGGLLALGLVIVTDITPLRQRPKYLAVLQVAWAIGSVTGPLLGGLFVQHVSWRWVFYINFPFCGFGLLAVPAVIKLRAQRASVKERLLHLDWIGGFLFISSTCSFLIGVSWGGTQFAWSSWRTLVPIFAGVAGIVGTLVWERYGTVSPFLRLGLFDSYSALAAYFGAVLQGLIIFCQLYYIPLYLASVRSYTPTIVGISMIPITAALLPSSVIVSLLVSRSGRYRWAIWLGWLITIGSAGLLILLDVDTKVHTWVPIFVAVGLGHGIVLMSLNFAVQAMAETKNVAYAAALYTFARTFGMAIGVAIGGAIFQNELGRRLGRAKLPKEVAKNAEGYLAVLKTMPKQSGQYIAFVTAYAKSIKAVFLVLTALAVLAAGMSLLIKGFTMDRELDSEHVLQRGGEKAVETSSA